MTRTHKGNWKITADHKYEDFRIFSIMKSERVNPRTGKSFGFFLMDGLDWVSVIPLTAENEVVLVRQYRHGAEEYTFEVPGGCVDQGEDPKDAALRELSEETGFQAEAIEHLGSHCPNAAMQSMRCHAFLAKNATCVAPQRLDAGEDIEVLKLPIAEVIEMLRDGRIIHGIVVAAFGHLALKHPDFIRSHQK